MNFPKNNDLTMQNLGAIIFDFDGVFTDNHVYTDSHGVESVRTSREDSYGLSLLKKHIETRKLNVEMFILSTETSSVVQQRAIKLGLRVEQAISNKREFLDKYFEENKTSKSWGSSLFLGNDLNDYEAMALAGYTACPNDAHPGIKEIATYVSGKPGGSGFIRDVIDLLLK